MVSVGVKNGGMSYEWAFHEEGCIIRSEYVCGEGKRPDTEEQIFPVPDGAESYPVPDKQDKADGRGRA